MSKRQRKTQDVEETPADVLASKLIDAWVADKGRKISWRRAIEIVAIITKQPQAEVDRLLGLGADDDGRCEMCGQPIAPESGHAPERTSETDQDNTASVLSGGRTLSDGGTQEQ